MDSLGNCQILETGEAALFCSLFYPLPPNFVAAEFLYVVNLSKGFST